MPIFDDIDCGRAYMKVGPSSGQEGGAVLVTGARTLSWGRGGRAQQRTGVVNVKAPTAIGGQAADTRAAVAFVVQQLVELAHNPNRNPVYIQWDSGDGILTPNAWDGYYRLDDVTPLDWSWERHVPCSVTATLVARGAPHTIYATGNLGLAYVGGSAPSNFSGAAANWLVLPPGAVAFELTGQPRPGAEGTGNIIGPPVANPEGYAPSVTIANSFKGGVKVYDTLGTASNPVPTTGGFVHANWVQVYDVDHDFVGDCVITNGLILLVIIGSSLVNSYFWDTTIATPAWAGGPNLSASGITLRTYSLERVGLEEASAILKWSDSATTSLETRFKLRRGSPIVGIDVKSLLAAIGVPYRLLGQHFVNPRIAYNSSKLTDPAIDAVNPQFVTDYGYGSYFYTTGHAIYGWLVANQTNGDQPYWNLAGGYGGPGDAISQAKDAWRSYGFFAIPYGVSGSYSVADLQAEAESGALDAGWTSQANAAASNGNEAKCASGTVTGRKNMMGTARVFLIGKYDLWVRCKVASIASGLVQMRLGIWQTSGAAWSAFTDYAPNGGAMATSYTWVRVAGAIDWDPNSFSATYQFRAETVATLATDWFIDEVCVALKKSTGGSNPPGYGPQELWQQWMYDRSVVLVP